MKRSTRPKRVEVQLASMQPEDIAVVLAIEQQSFTMPWTEAMFASELRNEPTSHMLVAHVGAANDGDEARVKVSHLFSVSNL